MPAASAAISIRSARSPFSLRHRSTNCLWTGLGSAAWKSPPKNPQIPPLEAPIASPWPKSPVMAPTAAPTAAPTTSARRRALRHVACGIVFHVGLRLPGALVDVLLGPCFAGLLHLHVGVQHGSGSPASRKDHRNDQDQRLFHDIAFPLFLLSLQGTATASPWARSPFP